MQRSFMTHPCDLNGTHIPIVGLRDPDYEIQLKSVLLPNGSVQFVSGYSFEILNLLQSSLNFTYSPVNGEGWIDRLPNGSWTGIGRQIFAGEAVLAMTPSSMLSYRLEAFDFLFPSGTWDMRVALRQPPSHSARNLVSSIFSVSVWSCALLTSVAALLLLKLTFLLTTHKLVALQGDDRLLQEPAFWILVTFCQRSLMGNPSSLPLRLVYISVLMTSLVGYVAFTASLVSVLSTEVQPIRSFGDLLRSDLDLLGDSSASYTHPIIQGLNEDRKRGQRSDSQFTDVRSGVRAVLNGGSAFTSSDESLYTAYRALNLTDEFLCKNVFHFSVPGVTFPAAMFVKKGSPCREPLNVKLSVSRERGFLFRLYSKWYVESQPKCVRLFSSSRHRPLTFPDVIAAFFALSAGVGGSAALFLLEILSAKRTTRSLRLTNHFIHSLII